MILLYKMTAYKRGGNKWTVNELLSLQREYELLEMSIQQIAAKHERSVTAILFKLETEGFIDAWNSARGFDILEYQKKMDGDDCDGEDCCDDADCCDGDSESEADTDEYVDGIVNRVLRLEADVKEIGYMVTHMFNNMVGAKQTTISCRN
jgi:hypothetical protein